MTAKPQANKKAAPSSVIHINFVPGVIVFDARPIAELEATDRGLTREGLVRDGTRHVKDDARPVDDPSARILGWTTDRKIAALRKQIVEAERRATSEAHAAAEAARTAAVARERANAAHDLLGIADFAEIDPFCADISDGMT